MKKSLSAFILLSVLILGVFAGCADKPGTDIETLPTTNTPETSVTTTVALTTEAAVSNEPAAVYATFAKDTDIALTNAQRFVADNSEYETEIVFTANSGVKNFNFCKIEWLDETDSGESDLELVPVFTTDSFEEPLVVTMTFWGDIPSYGITYTDTDGTEHSGIIRINGMDGSLILDVI